jgi:transposase
MDTPDARHLTIETQDYLRQQAIRLRLKGKRVKDISEYLGVHRNTVGDWWWQYEHEGEMAFHQLARGRAEGVGRILSPLDEADVQAAMNGHFPEDYEIDSALWTRRAVQALIEQLCGVKLPIRTVGEYLKRWRYTPQRPTERAYEQDPDGVAEWLEETYPAIVERTQQESASIEWGDESGLSSNEYGGRGYAPIGKTPEIRPSERKRDRLNFIASVSNTGHVQFMVYTCNLTVAIFIAFLKRLIHRHVKKLFWVTDRHPIHLNPKVKKWLKEHAEQIEMFNLPSYSPQLNPVEYLNGDVKQGVHDKPPSRNVHQFKQRLMSHLRKLQQLPERVKSYFQHPSIAYAAAL